MQATLLLRQLRRALPVLLGGMLAAGAVQAQPEPIKFGQIDKADLTAAPFVADSAAGAVVLCDFGRSRLRGKRSGFEIVFERVTRIKILKKSGYDEATVEIPLYHRENDQEKISNLRGFTYKLVNGVVEKTKLEPSGAFIEKRTPNVNVQKFTLPNVQEGAVIEYAYTLTSDFLFNFQDWPFQRSIPVRWSEYRVSIPTFYRYKIIYQSGQPFAIDKTDVGRTTLTIDNTVGDGLSAGLVNGSLNLSAATEEHQWALKDVPAFREEPYMTAAQDYVARLDFELTGEQWPEQSYHDLTGTWDKINARLLADDDFGGRLGQAGPLKDQLQALPAQFPDLAARAAAVREVVMAALRYDGTDRYFAREPLRKALEAHRGSAADVNLLLIAALREAGIPAQPLLLSTRDHGRISQEFPLLERFNYVAALVPLAQGNDLLVDATDAQLPCGMLPERCLNRVGRLITKLPNDGRWVDLTPAQRHVHFQQVSLTLDAGGGLSGQVHEEHAGYAGADARTQLAAQGEKKYLAGLQQRHEGWAVPKLTVHEADKVAKPLALDYELSQPGTEKPTGETFYLSPLREFGTAQNPFRHENRAFAVDFGAAHEEMVVVNLALPAGYELAEVPKPANISLANNGGRFIYNVSAPAAGRVQLTTRLTLNNAVYAAQEYAGLRELYRLLLEKQAEKLIIKKKIAG